MKKYFSIVLFAVVLYANAQVTANRFFYELTFKPKQDSVKMDKVMAILDITKDKSIYQDYTIISKDSLMKVEVEAMQKSGTYKDLGKSIGKPKFSERIYKFYPEMKIQYVDKIANGFTPVSIAYEENIKFPWIISNEKEKIESYNTQKATVDFGGRHWTAWFSTDIPFQDGPFKFSGLPGLIVKLEDSDKNYSWVLKGNKKVDNYSEFSYIETLMNATGGQVKVLPKDKFQKAFDAYKKDPFASVRPMLTKEMLTKEMPGTGKTVGDMVNKQEQEYKDFYNANDNPIEISTPEKK